jgi:hypothetical protein
MRRVAHRPQPSPEDSMAMDHPPVLNTRSYSRSPHPHTDWRTVTPPHANAQISPSRVGPPVNYQYTPVVSPTRGAAHRSQPPKEGLMSVCGPTVNAQGYSSSPSAHYNSHMRPPIDWGTVHPSHSSLEHSMAVDHPPAVNNRGYNSRAPTPQSHLTTVTPPPVNPHYSKPNPSPQADHTYAETLVTPARQMSSHDNALPHSRGARTPLKHPVENNTPSTVQHFGDIPFDQMSPQRLMAPEIQDEGFVADSRTSVGSPMGTPANIVNHSVDSSSTPLSGISNIRVVSPAQLYAHSTLTRTNYSAN